MGVCEIRPLILTVLFIVACGGGIPVINALPTASPLCVADGNYTSDVGAAYQQGQLSEWQRAVNEGVGTTRLRPDLAALEYLTSSDVANASSTKSWLLDQSGDQVRVFVCLKDGTQLRAEMYEPFPNETRPIWAVRSYSHSW